jgi:peptidoglycan/LPS O-acetylase OafA/YrhL
MAGGVEALRRTVVDAVGVNEPAAGVAGPGAAVRRVVPRAERDRYVDLLRLGAVVLVALGHWVLALLVLCGDDTIGANLPAMLATWVWQVMPLFFFVGGFAHARALDHGPAYAVYVRARLARLLPPALVFVAVATAVAAPIDLAGAATGQIGRGLRLLPSVLWFLGVYLLVVLLAPLTVRLHRRWATPALAGFALAAGAVDALARLAPSARLGVVNLVVVWLAIHQLGYAYADGSLLRGGRRLALGLTIGGLGATAGLVFGLRAYPVAMVGLPGHGASNMSPPTAALLGQGVFLIGLALLVRPLALTWLRRERPWRLVATGNTVIMTIYCWHPVAIGLMAGALRLGGLRLPGADTPMWGLALVGWVAGCAVCTVTMVLAFGRVERPRDPPPARTTPTVLAALAAAVGLYLLSQVGLDDLVTFHTRAVHGVPINAGCALLLVAIAAALGIRPAWTARRR